VSNIFSQKKTIGGLVHTHPIGTSIATVTDTVNVYNWSVWNGKRWIHGCTTPGLDGITAKGEQ
jgi:hypothetical protein